MLFHHIGIACSEIEKTIEVYKKLGYEPTDVIFDPIQKVNLCFLSRENSPVIELVGAEDENSPIKNILKKNGTSPYHTCYEVDSICIQIKKLVKEGFFPITGTVKAVAFSGRNICFLYNKNFGLIELLESK